MWARLGTEPEPGVEGDSVTFVLHAIKETFSYQNAVIKLEGRSALRTESALITLGPLANQLRREGLGLESLSVVTCGGLRRAVTSLTLLLLECSSKEALGRGVQRCRGWTLHLMVFTDP